MIKNYLKIALRFLRKNKMHSLINITGLSVGMAVAVLIALWIWDELSFNKTFQNYDRIAQVMQNQTFDGEVGSQRAFPYVMGNELMKSFGSDFKYSCMASWTNDHILSFADKIITKGGNFMEPQITEMLSLKMIEGTRAALKDNHSIILSASTANELFGKTDPVNKIIKIDNQFSVKVTGVYEDMPYNSDFKDLTFIAPWQIYIDSWNWPWKFTNPWRTNGFQTQNYQYHTEISWWIFAAAASGALFITLLTVSFQAIKAALANPVNSLRSE